MTFEDITGHPGCFNNLHLFQTIFKVYNFGKICFQFPFFSVIHAMEQDIGSKDNNEKILVSISNDDDMKVNRDIIIQNLVKR